MAKVSDLMSQDHRHCDDLFTAAESAIDAQDFDTAKAAWGDFVSATEGHFQLEEGVLFPGFEAATGMTSGPTAVMRNEHQIMRELLSAVSAAIDANDARGALGHCESLMLYMQQHNMKEEQILYPMLNQHLPAESTCEEVERKLSRN
ncbi:MAG: hemerythrin domain-containing protein [Hahellaceae bacterium]|nr:hemerythrin domain-containing protein [Hahellaceae bacterium]MCP5168775.1 hemerythrin domain-containing protein [Hahellaceae bacterium]